MKFLSKILCFLVFFAPILGYCAATYVPNVDDTAYDASSWDGNEDAATKNAIRDKIETLAGGHDEVTIDTNVDDLLTLTGQAFSFKTQVKNKVFASPATGADAIPGFRTLVADDIPDLSSVYQPSDADLTTYAGITPSANAQTLLGETFAQMLSSIGAAPVAQTFYIGTTQIAINRGSGALTIAGLTLTTPEIGEATGTSLHLTTLLSDHIGEHTGSHGVVFDNAITARITPRIVTTTDDATAVIDVDITDQYQLTAVANATEFSTTGTPTAGQKLLIRFKDAGVAKAITWNAVFTAVGVTAPTTTTAGKTTYVGCIYNATDSKWNIVAVGTEA